MTYELSVSLKLALLNEVENYPMIDHTRLKRLIIITVIDRCADRDAYSINLPKDLLRDFAPALTKILRMPPYFKPIQYEVVSMELP